MSELTIAKRERIERVMVRRRAHSSRQREHTEVQKGDNLLVWITLGFSALILGIVFLINAEWQPGNQDQIAREYRATRHEAQTVAVEEWK